MESANNSLKVLLVDDDSTCLAIVAAMLKKLKFQVVAVKNANDAIVTLRTRGDFDVVISDVHMPDINGFQLQLMIFQEFRIPVVLMSGDNHEGIVRQGMQNGALSFIKKPVSVNDLRGLWRYITAQKKSKVTSAMEQVDTGNQDNANQGIGGNSGTRSNPGSDTTSKKKMVWTDPLHFKFLDAISSLGAENAVPKNILKAMNVPGLTRENVASHLQKYRQFLRRNIQELENRFNGQPRFGAKRVSRLAKLEQLFAQGQLNAALSSPTSSAALGGDNSGGHANPRGRGVRSSQDSSDGGQQGVPLSEHDELMFYRGLSRDPVIANPNSYSPASHEVNAGSVESGNYPTLTAYIQNNSGHFDNTNVSGFGNANVVSGSFQMNEQGGYVLPENYDQYYAGLLNFIGEPENDGGENNNSAQGGGQQFSAPSPYFVNSTNQETGGQMQYVAPPTAPPQQVTFSGYGNEGDNYNYGGLSPIYDLSMYENINAGQDNSGGNQMVNLTNDFINQVNINQQSYPPNQQIGNEYGMNYNSEQWYGYTPSPWYMPAGTSQPNFNQQYYSPTQRDGNDDDFVNSVYGSNPYGGAGNGEGM